jgi:hypothetical protein
MWASIRPPPTAPRRPSPALAGLRRGFQRTENAGLAPKLPFVAGH